VFGKHRVNAVAGLSWQERTYNYMSVSASGFSDNFYGVVKSILPFGAFVEILPGKDGLLHISEISWDRLESMETSGIHEGDEVTVKLIEIDKKTGKYRLSMKALLPRPERAPRSDRHSRNDNNQ
jgi:polyribonucleotide nucleotidyltransferase